MDKNESDDTITLTEEIKLCPKCKQAIKEESRFCGYCGHEMRGGVERGKRKIPMSNVKFYFIIALIIVAPAIGVYIAKEKHDVDVYKQLLIETISLLQRDTVKCLMIGDDILKGWHDAIESRKDIDVGIRIALRKNSDELDNLEKNKYTIEAGVSKLKNPPPQYVETHKLLVELYAAYSGIYLQVKSPSGSYLSYNQDMHKKADEVMTLIEKIKVIMPDSP